MKKYSVECGLNHKGVPIIKCSPEYYEQLIDECRHLIHIAKQSDTLKNFLLDFPAIGALATMPKMSESINSN